MALLARIKPYKGILIVVILSLFAIKHFFLPGFFPMHDDTQVARVHEMSVVLREGIFPVRWVPDLGYGYGYPIFNFYAPFAYYLGASFTFLGFDTLFATKLMIALGALLAGVTMYLFAREFWGEKGGILSGLLYMYAPYHALDIFVRGAISELWGYGFVPLVFYSYYKLYCSLQKKSSPLLTWLWVCGSAISYALLIISHNLTAFMVTPFLIVVLGSFGIALYRKKKNRWHLFFVSVILAFILSAFYWMPAVFESKFTNVASIIGGKSDYKIHFVCLSQLYSSPWGFAGSAPGCITDGMSFRIGKLHLLVGLFTLVLFILGRIKTTQRFTFTYAVSGFLIATFMTLEQSQFIWEAFPQMAFFQFPWRFLMLSLFFLSFLGGALAIALPRRLQQPSVIIIVVALIITSRVLFSPAKMLDVNADYYTSTKYITWITSKISDEYMPIGFVVPHSQNQVPTSKIVAPSGVPVTMTKSLSHELKATISTKRTTDILLNIAYFPSWNVFLNSKQVSYTPSAKGLVVTIPSGKHELRATLTQTPLEQVSNFLSLTGVILMITGIITLRKRSYEYKKEKS